MAAVARSSPDGMVAMVPIVPSEEQVADVVAGAARSSVPGLPMEIATPRTLEQGMSVLSSKVIWVGLVHALAAIMPPTATSANVRWRTLEENTLSIVAHSHEARDSNGRYSSSIKPIDRVAVSSRNAVGFLA